MAKKTVGLAPDTELLIKKMGTRIKKARLRRNISMESLAEIAGISKFTLSAIERGEKTVSIGAYAVVLFALGLDKDFEQIAVDEEGKKEFWGQNLCNRERASKRNGKA